MKKKESRKSPKAAETPNEETTPTESGASGASSDDSGSPEDGSAAKSDSPRVTARRDEAGNAAKKETPKKTSLPAFGFADDLLKKKPADDAPADGGGNGEAEGEPSAEPHRAEPSDEGGTDDEKLTRAVRDVDPEAPTRVFDFVDRLQDDEDDEERRPVRLGTFVTFDLAGETFAMPVDPVRQVVRVSAITRVPHAPRPIRGVTNLRGRVIPVIDLRLRVGLEATELDRSARVVAVASRGRLLGLLVDAVHQVIHLDLDQIQPPPEDVMTLQSDYIRGVYEREDGLILLLDVDRALIIREAGAA